MTDQSAYWQAQMIYWGPKVLIALLILIATWVIARAVKWVLQRAIDREPRRVDLRVERSEVRLARTDYGRNRGRNPLPDYAAADKEQNLTTARGDAGFEFVDDDLRTAAIEPLLDGVDVVFHQAAQAGVRLSWSDGLTRDLTKAPTLSPPKLARWT